MDQPAQPGGPDPEQLTPNCLKRLDTFRLASPLGWSVQYVAAACDAVVSELTSWRQCLGTVTMSPPAPFKEALKALLPFESPWTRELLAPCGTWTAYLNNGAGGGDATASAAVVARRMKARHVMAENAPWYGPGHAATQVWVSGPGGDGPLMSIRTVSVAATDGRWEWYEEGAPLPFEEVERYGARRKRDMFDRDLLLRYLDALGIPAHDDSAYGPGVVVQQHVAWPRRTTSLEEERSALGLPTR